MADSTITPGDAAIMGAKDSSTLMFRVGRWQGFR
jgi:hypothetical protein